MYKELFFRCMVNSNVGHHRNSSSLGGLLFFCTRLFRTLTFVQFLWCSAQTVTRIGLLEEIPRSGVQIPCLS
jgi:hypothetical protein